MRVLFLFFSFFIVTCYAQQSLHNSPRQLYKVGEEFKKVDPSKACKTFSDAYSHISENKNLNNLQVKIYLEHAQCLIDSQNYTDSKSLVESVKELIINKERKKKHLLWANILMSEIYSGLGEIDKGNNLLKDAYKQSLKIQFNLQDLDVLERLGNNLKYIEELEAALEVFNIYHKIVSPKSKEVAYEYANSLLNIASLKNYQYHDIEAAELGEKAIDFIENNHIDNEQFYAESLTTSAYYLNLIGKSNLAIDRIEKAIPIFQSLKEEESLIIAKITLGDLYDNKNKLEEALEEKIDAKGIVEKLGGINHPYYAPTHMKIANTYHLMGKDELAISYYDSAKNNTDQSSPYYTHIQKSLADCYAATGRIGKALKMYKALLDSEDASSLAYCESYTHLGSLFFDLSKYSDALEQFDLALTCAKQNGNENTNLNLFYANYAAALIEHDREEEALTTYQKIYESLSETADKESRDYLISKYNYGYAYYRLGNYKQAHSIMLDAVNDYANIFGKDRSEYAWMANGLGENYLGLGNREKGMEFLEMSNDIYISKVDKIFRFSNDKAKEGFMKSLIKNFTALQEQAAKYHYEITELNELNINNQLLLKSLLLNESRNVLTSLADISDQATKGQLGTYYSINSELQLAIQSDLLKQKSETKRLQTTLDSIQTELVKTYNRYYEPVRNLDRNWKDISKSLKSSETAIEFSHFKNRGNSGNIEYVAYVFNKDSSTPQVVPLTEEESLKKIINSRSINSLYTSKNLYDLIWRPIQNVINNSHRIYYSTTGILNQIQFAALFDGKNFLVQNYNLYQLSSTADIISHANKFNLGQSLLIGGIQFNYENTNPHNEDVAEIENDESNIYSSTSVRGNKTRGESWTYLPGTLTEITSVQSILGQSEKETIILSEAAATESQFKAFHGDSPSLIHIATHGYFFENLEETSIEDDTPLTFEDQLRVSDDPFLRSGLLMAGSNYAWQNGHNPYEVEDGILTALEIKNLDLSATELVVLSACETGLGDINGWEGVYGLQRAFKLAGVDKIIMSLWKIPDEETAEFVFEFYKNLFESSDLAQSFIKTQIRQSKKYPSEPVKWAGFVLVN